MGLSTTMVSVDDHGLDNLLQKPPESAVVRRQPTPKSEPLKCPRCESTNTKFCYYNNYNKSQPRHFCKACKRHWTEGGTLRNVPVGGGRKNKRLRPTDPVDYITGRECVTLNVNDQMCPLVTTTMPVSTIFDEEKRGSDIFNQTLNFLSSYDHTISNFSVFNEDSVSISSICSVPCSIPSSVQSSSVYEYMGKFDGTMEESTITKVMPMTSSSLISQVAETNNPIENIPSDWSWTDFDTLGAADLNIHWDDLEIKP